MMITYTIGSLENTFLVEVYPATNMGATDDLSVQFLIFIPWWLVIKKMKLKGQWYMDMSIDN
jgi:hypothetical protein